MVAAEQDLGHCLALELGRSRVLRVLEQAVGERLLDDRFGLDCPGQQAQHGVDDDHRRQLAAGQHVVADRQLQIDHPAHPVVDALVARAHEQQVLRGGKL